MVVVRRHIMKDAEASKRFIAYSLDCATLMGEQTPGWDGKYSGVFDLRGEARGKTSRRRLLQAGISNMT